MSDRGGYSRGGYDNQGGYQQQQRPAPYSGGGYSVGGD